VPSNANWHAKKAALEWNTTPDKIPASSSNPRFPTQGSNNGKKRCFVKDFTVPFVGQPQLVRSQAAAQMIYEGDVTVKDRIQSSITTIGAVLGSVGVLVLVAALVHTRRPRNQAVAEERATLEDLEYDEAPC
jgi:hypothetical protein